MMQSVSEVEAFVYCGNQRLDSRSIRYVSCCRVAYGVLDSVANAALLYFANCLDTQS